MLLLKSVATQTPHGWYLSVGQERHCASYIEVRPNIYSAEFGSIDDARAWFKSKIAEFLHQREEHLTPLWWWLMPYELQ